MSGIRLHKEFGLNPTITQCLYCGEDKNELALLGASYNGEAPRHAVIDRSPCDKCSEFMKLGVILIEVRDGEYGNSPYRSGGWWVVTETAVRKMFSDPGPALKMRMAFIEESAAKKMGLKKEVKK